MNLGMELHGEPFLRDILDPRDGMRSLRSQFEAGGNSSASSPCDIQTG